MLKRIRKEAFFIKKLFSQRYEMTFYFNYFKNKFFGATLLARLPSYKCNVDSKLSLHILCQEEDVGMIEWSVRSFLEHTGLCPRIIIHDDGTMTKKSALLLEKRFSNLRVLFKKDALRALSENPGFKGIIKKFSEGGHKVLIQLIDIFLLSDTEKVILMDGDVLFFKQPQELIDFVNGRYPYDAMVSWQNGNYDLVINDEYSKKYSVRERKAPEMNPGLIVYNKSSISLDKLVEFLNNTKRNYNDYFLAMTGWACLLSQSNYKFFSEDKYIIKGRPTGETVMKHFTNPRRHEFFGYGIDLSRNRRW